MKKVEQDRIGGGRYNVALMIYLVAHQRTVRECITYKGEIDCTVTAEHWCERKSKTERLQAL